MVNTKKMKPYSLDLRERIVKAVKEEGLSKAAAAKRYNVSKTSAYDYLKRSEQGKLEADKPTGRIPKLDKKGCQKLLKQVEKYPDLSLQEHADRYAEKQGIRLTFSGINTYFKRLGIRRKKRPFTPENVMKKRDDSG